jgi:hypothetical protein
VNNVSALNYAVSPSYNTPRWLVRGQTAHILPPLLAHRLNETVFVGIAFGRTNKGHHHDILGDCLVALHCLVVQHKKVAISSPAELSI